MQDPTINGLPVVGFMIVPDRPHRRKGRIIILDRGDVKAGSRFVISYQYARTREKAEWPDWWDNSHYAQSEEEAFEVMATLYKKVI